jgi:DNA processing protein
VEPKKLEGGAIPARVRALENPPREFWVAGALDETPRAVAIVGSRAPTDDAERFARKLAEALAEVGVVVVSGGAIGIDAAAHRGALDAGGVTWCVAPTGHRKRFPKAHGSLFSEIPRRGGAMIWPFPPEREALRMAFAARNRILVALSDAVVIVQAGIPSGTLNAAVHCRAIGRPLYVVGIDPWSPAFDGSRMLLERCAFFVRPPSYETKRNQQTLD